MEQYGTLVITAMLLAKVTPTINGNCQDVKKVVVSRTYNITREEARKLADLHKAASDSAHYYYTWQPDNEKL